MARDQGRTHPYAPCCVTLFTGRAAMSLSTEGWTVLASVASSSVVAAFITYAFKVRRALHRRRKIEGSLEGRRPMGSIVRLHALAIEVAKGRPVKTPWEAFRLV